MDVRREEDPFIYERIFHGILAAGLLVIWIVPSPLGESLANGAVRAIAVEAVLLIIGTFLLMSFMLPASGFRVLNLACGWFLLIGFLVAYYWPFDSGWELLVGAVLFFDHALAYRRGTPRRNTQLLVERSYRILVLFLIVMIGGSAPVPALGLADLAARIDDPQSILPHRVVALAVVYFTVLTLLTPQRVRSFVSGTW